MLHNPENYITQLAHVKKSETIKQMQTDEVGENGIERKFQLWSLAIWKSPLGTKLRNKSFENYNMYVATYLGIPYRLT